MTTVCHVYYIRYTFFCKRKKACGNIRISPNARRRSNDSLFSYNLFTKSNDIQPIPLFSLPHPAELPLPLLTSTIVYTPIGIN